MSYDTALRREEICSLETTDIDPAHRLLRIRPEKTKNRTERIVPYSPATSELFSRYLLVRRELSRERGPLFLSESCRNHGQPISIWTWSKAIARVAERCNLPRFTPHSLRHLCLTDLARTNWDIHEIATFAGHRSVQTTALYVQLSGRDLANKLARGGNTCAPDSDDERGAGMNERALGLTPWVWPVKLDDYDRSTELKIDEADALRANVPSLANGVLPSVVVERFPFPQLLKPLEDVCAHIELHQKYRTNLKILMLRDMAGRGKSYWGWTEGGRSGGLRRQREKEKRARRHRRKALEAKR